MRKIEMTDEMYERMNDVLMYVLEVDENASEWAKKTALDVLNVMEEETKNRVNE